MDFTLDEPVCILLGGTSGSGKSTLSSLLASRLGLTNVISTDHIRQLLREFCDFNESDREMVLSDRNHLWSSSYQVVVTSPESIGPDDTQSKKLLIDSYERQNELIFPHLRELIRKYISNGESVIVEGVHLSTKVMMQLMKDVYVPKNEIHCAKTKMKIFPFLMFISNPVKHTERFAIRAKYMTLHPKANKYIKYFENIRCVQTYLCANADEANIPKIDNTNVDRSLAYLYQTIQGYISKQNLKFLNYRMTHNSCYELPESHINNFLIDISSIYQGLLGTYRQKNVLAGLRGKRLRRATIGSPNDNSQHKTKERSKLEYLDSKRELIINGEWESVLNSIADDAGCIGSLDHV